MNRLIRETKYRDTVERVLLQHEHCCLDDDSDRVSVRDNLVKELMKMDEL